MFAIFLYFRGLFDTKLSSLKFILYTFQGINPIICKNASDRTKYADLWTYLSQPVFLKFNVLLTLFGPRKQTIVYDHIHPNEREDIAKHRLKEIKKIKDLLGKKAVKPMKCEYTSHGKIYIKDSTSTNAQELFLICVQYRPENSPKSLYNVILFKDTKIFASLKSEDLKNQRIIMGKSKAHSDNDIIFDIQTGEGIVPFSARKLGNDANSQIHFWEKFMHSSDSVVFISLSYFMAILRGKEDLTGQRLNIEYKQIYGPGNIVNDALNIELFGNVYERNAAISFRRAHDVNVHITENGTGKVL